MSETDLSLAIAKALDSLGYPVIRVQSGAVKATSMRGGKPYVMRLAPSGTPDRCVLLRRGRVAWIEVKDKKNILSLSQVQWRARMEKLGHRVIVVRSVREAIAAVRAADAEAEA